MNAHKYLISIMIVATGFTSGCGGAKPVVCPAPIVAAPSVVALAEPAPFDADAAFAEFERELRAWYAYLDRDDLDLEALLTRVGEAARLRPDALSFRALLHRALYAFTDAHLLVGPLADDALNVGPTSADLALSLVDERYRVADVRAGSAADLAGVRPGWRLVNVDWLPIEPTVFTVLDLVPNPTAHQRIYAANLLANGRRTGTRTLDFETPEGPRTVTLANPRDFAQSLADAPPVEVSLREGVAVIRLNNALGRAETLAAFDAAVTQHQRAHTLVLDLRNTPSGGNSEVARGVMGHFVTTERPYQMHAVPGVERRSGVPRQSVEYVLPREPYFPGRLVVFGGRWTGSMGEGTVIGLHAAAGATVFASDMGDLLGAVQSLPLTAAQGVLEMGVESLFHVNGTPRAEFVAENPLPSSDRDATGGDPAWAALHAWLARYPR